MDLLQGGHVLQAGKELFTGFERSALGATPEGDMPGAGEPPALSSPASTGWGTAFSDTELGVDRFSAPENIPDTEPEIFPGDPLPPLPPLVTPIQEAQPHVLTTPIPDRAKAEPIGGGLVPPDMPDLSVLENREAPGVKLSDPYPSWTKATGQLGGEPVGERETSGLVLGRKGNGAFGLKMMNSAVWQVTAIR